MGRPGHAGLEHRIGGLEKEDVTGNISYDPDNHDLMVRLRAQKVAGIAADIPELAVDDPDGDAQPARARLGLDVRADRRRRAEGAARRPEGGERAPTPPEPVPAQHGRRRPALREGARPGDEPRAAREHDPRRSSSSMRCPTTVCAAAVHGAELAEAISAMVEA